jgi:hypothetical protein
MARTTLNINVDIFSRISTAATKLGKPRREVIVLLLMRIMQNHSMPHRGFTTVKYQPDDDKDKWHPFQICIRPDENEFFMDLRKFCKYSVSYLVAIAVEKYLDQLVDDAGGTGIHNYVYYRNYVIYREVVDGVISWRLYWGYPSEELKTFRL